MKKIQYLTANRYAEACPELSEWQVIKAVKAENYQGGVKITATDLRDVFATVVMDNVRNPIRRADSCGILRLGAGLGATPNVKMLKTTSCANSCYGWLKREPQQELRVSPR